MAAGGYSFVFDLDKRVVIRNSHADYPAANGRPAFSHHDLMIVYPENENLRADYFDNEGHVIHYKVRFPVVNTVEFCDDQYRLTYRKLKIPLQELVIMFREVTPQQHPFSRGARPTITAVIACIALLLVLSSWNLAVSEWQNRHNPVPGELYSVEGRQMHLYCTGSGSPTVVIEAGVGSDWLGWQVVQPRLSHMTQVCTYDRSGLGWSEPRSGVRDAEAIARQLHELLATAGVKPPYVLAGHSGGGFYVREYAREFPAEVVGVVLVDSTSPQQIDELPSFRASYEEDKRNFKKDLWEDRLGVWSGWDRLMGSCHGNPGRGLESLAAYYDAKECRPGFVDTDFAEYRDFELSAREASRLTTFGEIPLLILSRDPNQPGQRSSPTAVASRAIWDREQEALKSLSRMSWRVIARGSGHKIFQDRAELVLAETTRLVDFVRGGTPPPFGTTITQ